MRFRSLIRLLFLNSNRLISWNWNWLMLTILSFSLFDLQFHQVYILLINWLVQGFFLFLGKQGLVFNIVCAYTKILTIGQQSWTELVDNQIVYNLLPAAETLYFFIVVEHPILLIIRDYCQIMHESEGDKTLEVVCTVFILVL